MADKSFLPFDPTEAKTLALFKHGGLITRDSDGNRIPDCRKPDDSETAAMLSEEFDQNRLDSNFGYWGCFATPGVLWVVSYLFRDTWRRKASEISPKQVTIELIDFGERELAEKLWSKKQVESWETEREYRLVVRIPRPLQKRLETTADRLGINSSVLTRDALEFYLDHAQKDLLGVYDKI